MYTVVMYPWLFWAAWYIHRTHEGATMVGTERKNFQNLCLQMF